MSLNYLQLIVRSIIFLTILVVSGIGYITFRTTFLFFENFAIQLFISLAVSLLFAFLIFEIIQNGMMFSGIGHRIFNFIRLRESGCNIHRESSRIKVDSIGPDYHFDFDEQGYYYHIISPQTPTIVYLHGNMARI